MGSTVFLPLSCTRPYCHALYSFSFLGSLIFSFLQLTLLFCFLFISFSFIVFYLHFVCAFLLIVLYRSQMTCLMLAARDGYSKVINLLVSHGAEINTQDCNGYTVCHSWCFLFHSKSHQSRSCCSTEVTKYNVLKHLDDLFYIWLCIWWVWLIFSLRLCL